MSEEGTLMEPGPLWTPLEALHCESNGAFVPCDIGSQSCLQTAFLPGSTVCRYVRRNRLEDRPMPYVEALAACPSANAVVLDETSWPQQQQQEALAQREKLAGLGSLIAGVAHELNNPLAVVMMQAEILHEELQEGPLAEQANAIMQAAEHCVRLVHNLLNLVRQHPSERRPVQLNSVIMETLQLPTSMLRVDDIAVELHLAPELPLLSADPHQLHQVVLNLVTNAYQALCEVPPPRRRLRLTTRSHPERTTVSLEVADTGPGIPPAIQARIFEPFFTTKPLGRGTGLGLSLCQDIIEGYGGTIRLRSQPAHGTVFDIELPVKAKVADRAQAPGAEPPRETPERTATILVVDDEPGVLKALAYLLRRMGHEVDTAVNGHLALEKLQTRAYDLILSDLRMPECDGPALYDVLQRHQPQLCQRISFLTGDTLNPEIQAFLEQVGTPHLNKPCRAAQVQQAVQQVLRALQEKQQLPGRTPDPRP